MAASTGSGAGPGDPKGLYATLGVATTADVAEIRKAYRRLALKWHPDKNPDNPEATGEFQRISAAYEVLSEESRRDMYDRTGCIDEEELESGDFDHAADIFAAFFGGAGSMDLDLEEQAMFDEFLRIAGGGAFRRRRGVRRRGRGGRGGLGASRARAREQDMVNELFMAAMGAAPPAPACPNGHTLKRRKADAEYQCDVCERRISEGKRFFDCRRCDFSVCQKCQKAAEEQALEGDDDEEYRELFEAVCEACVTPDRQGRRLQLRCNFCQELFPGQEAAQDHMMQAHPDEVECLMQEIMEQDSGGLGGLDDLMAASLGGMFGGFDGPMSAGSGGPRRSRKKR